MNSVDWGYYDKFDSVNDKYLPSYGEGESLASQVVTAVNKLIYKWYNDGDVFDNVHSGLSGWCNDLSSYANWLYSHVPQCGSTLKSINDCSEDEEYENLLKDLADMLMTEDFLSSIEDSPKNGTIYSCSGPFMFSESYEEDDYWDDEEDEPDEEDSWYEDEEDDNWEEEG